MARVTADIAALLCARLEAEGRGARRFELAFHRLDGRSLPLTIGLALPGRDPSAITRLFAPLLETVDPGFGVEVVTLAASEVEPLAAPASAGWSRAARSRPRKASRPWSTGWSTVWATTRSGAPSPRPATRRNAR